MAERTRGYAHSVDVQAPRALIWRGLLEPALVSQWLGKVDRISARLGGVYRLKLDQDLEREAHIDVFEQDRRLRLIWMPERNMPGGASVIVDDFLLADNQNCSTLRLLGSGYPTGDEWDDFYVRMRTGWAQAVARLKVLSEKLKREGATSAGGGLLPRAIPRAS